MPNSPLLDPGGGVGRVVVADFAACRSAGGAGGNLAHIAISETDLAARALGTNGEVAGAALPGRVDAFIAAQPIA